MWTTWDIFAAAHRSSKKSVLFTFLLRRNRQSYGAFFPSFFSFWGDTNFLEGLSGIMRPISFYVLALREHVQA